MSIQPTETMYAAVLVDLLNEWAPGWAPTGKERAEAARYAKKLKKINDWLEENLDRA